MTRRVFEDADRLDLGRHNASQQLGWGHGPHYCLGTQLARMEITALLEGLAREVESIEPAGEAAVDRRPLRERGQAPAGAFSAGLTPPLPVEAQQRSGEVAHHLGEHVDELGGTRVIGVAAQPPSSVARQSRSTPHPR